MSVLGGVGCPARRCLQVLVVIRRFAPGISVPADCLEVGSPSGTCPLPGDFTPTILVCVIYKAFGDDSKLSLLVFLELSSEHIP